MPVSAGRFVNSSVNASTPLAEAPTAAIKKSSFCGAGDEPEFFLLVFDGLDLGRLAAISRPSRGKPAGRGELARFYALSVLDNNLF